MWTPCLAGASVVGPGSGGTERTCDTCTAERSFPRAGTKQVRRTSLTVLTA